MHDPSHVQFNVSGKLRGTLETTIETKTLKVEISLKCFAASCHNPVKLPPFLPTLVTDSVS